MPDGFPPMPWLALAETKGLVFVDIKPGRGLLARGTRLGISRGGQIAIPKVEIIDVI